MIFPSAQRIFRFLWGVVVLLINKGAGIGDHTSKPIGPEPGHRQGCRAARTATHNRSPPRVLSEGKLWESSFDLGVIHDRRQYLVMDKAAQAIGHRVVFETALALFAIIAAIFNRNGDERRQLMIRI